MKETATYYKNIKNKINRQTEKKYLKRRRPNHINKQKETKGDSKGDRKILQRNLFLIKFNKANKQIKNNKKKNKEAEKERKE